MEIKQHNNLLLLQQPPPLRAWATQFSGDLRDGDGTTCWEHFQTVAQVNNWTPVQQVAYLGLYLSGN